MVINAAGTAVERTSVLWKTAATNARIGRPIHVSRAATPMFAPRRTQSPKPHRLLRLDLMRRYNGMNGRMGYRHLNIVTPMEVAYEPYSPEDQDV